MGNFCILGTLRPSTPLCPPSTRYDPLKKHLFSKDTDSSVQRRVGIVGLGGLGVMGARIAKAKGCSVTCISRSAEKKSLSDSCGSDVFLVSTDPAQMQAECGTLDLILNTIPLYHDYIQYQKLLAPGGKQVILGLHKGLPGAMVANGVLCGASKVTASGIGGIINTQEVIDLCAQHNIRPEISIFPAHEINEVYTKLDSNNDAGLRYVMDIENTLNEDTLLKCTAAAPTIKPATGTISCCACCSECCWLVCCCKAC